MDYNKNIDVTVVGNVLMADGIGRQGIGLIKTIHKDLSVNMLQMQPVSYKDISPEVLKVLLKSFDGFGRVTFWTYILGLNPEIEKIHSSITSPLKIAYSMFESTKIPELWTRILNKYYDMVVVPDSCLVEIYQQSGVRIPIFVVPLGIIIEELLKIPDKKSPNDIFTFGISGGFWKRKNHLKVLQSFYKLYGNDPKFQLKIHGRFGPCREEIEKEVKKYSLKNVELITQPLSNLEYNKFMENLDCYVFPSCGEGFSITPREALALGRPCILSNNSSHLNIVKTGYVLPIKSKLILPAFYEVFNEKIGNYHDCTIEDLSLAMKEVVDNYPTYLEKAQQGREWVKQYLWTSLKPTYLTLLKPSQKQIILGNKNVVTSEKFETSSAALISKLRGLF